MIIVAKCNFCSHTNTDPEEALAHEKECQFNISNVGCSICKHYEFADYTTDLVCTLRQAECFDNGGIDCPSFELDNDTFKESLVVQDNNEKLKRFL